MKQESSMLVDPVTVDIVVGLHCFFNDVEKVAFWLKTKNLNFGGCAPIDLINRGRAHKVQQFINDALERNEVINGDG